MKSYRSHCRGRRAGGALRLECLEHRQLLTATAWSSYARDAQHTAQSTVAGQALDVIHWQTPVDSAPQYSGDDLLIHYGSPVVTVNNTVVVPEKNEANPDGYDVKAFDGATGALKWTQTEGEEFKAPAHAWTPSYSPALAELPGGTRLYFAGGAGTVFYRDAPDDSGAVTPGRIAFYGIASYNDNPAAFDDVRISSPLTVDSQGNLFFTYRAGGTNPLGLHGGIARVAADGTLSYADVGTPALDSAPAISNDGTKLYVPVQFNGNNPFFLVEYDSSTLVAIHQVALGSVNLSSSASPTVGPDGDVFFGVLSPSVHFRGSLSHFSGDLQTTYTPGSFGWDDTVSIVPATMVPGYDGPSTYLLMTKYNDYANGGVGSGVNKIAIIDPKVDTLDDPVTHVPAMKTVKSVAGLTHDSSFPNNPDAVREWCINTAVVDPVSGSIFANNEDGWLYRWDLTNDTLTKSVQLTNGIGEAYTPTVIGADGTVFAINNAILFAVGQRPSISIGDVSLVEGNAGTTDAVFTVSLSSSTAEQVTVNFTTNPNGAAAGSDYQTTSGVLTFAPATSLAAGSTMQTITVPINGDGQLESDEGFFVDLSAAANASISDAQAVGTIINDDSAVAARQLFYNQSTWDGGVDSETTGDDSAIATDKTAYLAGSGAASSTALSSYLRGINGVMVDLLGGGAHTAIDASDFIFKTGNDNTPSGWATAPAPILITVRTGAAASSSDRVEILWGANAVKKAWLEVEVLNTSHTGLAATDVFYWGNMVGDSNLNFSTTGADASNVLAHVGGDGSINGPLDHNRSKSISGADASVALANVGSLTRINLTAGAMGPVGGNDTAGIEAGPAVAADSGIASFLAATPAPGSSGGSSSPLPSWIAARLQDPDSRRAATAAYFQHLADEHRGPSRSNLAKADHVADVLDLDDDCFEWLATSRAR